MLDVIEILMLFGMILFVVLFLFTVGSIFYFIGKGFLWVRKYLKQLKVDNNIFKKPVRKYKKIRGV
jgi:hypothetical protein